MDLIIITSDPEAFTDKALAQIRGALELLDFFVATITVEVRP